MHLLKAVIDLEKTPAPIVVLSTADSSLTALAQAIEALPANFPDVRLIIPATATKAAPKAFAANVEWIGEQRWALRQVL